MIKTTFSITGRSVRRTRYAVLGFLAAMVLGVPKAALAATVEGTIITNQMFATYSSLSRAQYSMTYLVTATVMVGNPDISVRKESIPPMQVAGGTVKFCMWLVNNSMYASAWSVIVTDKVNGSVFSGGMSYVAGGLESWSGTPGSTVRNGYDANIMFVLPVWDSEPPDGVMGYSIRFLVEPIGPGQSAMVCFRARVL